MPSGGSCLLGSINLAAFVDNTGAFEFTRFCKAVGIAVRALNEVLDEGLTKHPLKEQRRSVTEWRQIGLGIMGLADMLIKMKLKYGSPDAVYLCDYLGKLMAGRAIAMSNLIAQEKGCYSKYNDAVLDSDFFRRHQLMLTTGEINNIKQYGLRNSQLLTIAPTGTLSTMLGISGGIEPIFANSYTRLTKSLHGKDVEYKVYTPIVAEYMAKNGIEDEAALPNYFVTSSTISVPERIEMQSTWQAHIDASISSTVNLPEEATVEDVKEIYMSAWKKRLKGVTVFRSGCARAAILTTPTKKDADEKKENRTECESRVSDANSSPENLYGLEHHLTTGCGSLHICAFFDEAGNLKNTYLSKGSTGGCNNFMIGLSRMISLAARKGVGIHDIVDQLNSCGTCPSYAVRRATKHDVSPGSCCPVAIGNALMEMWQKFNCTKMQSQNNSSDTKTQLKDKSNDKADKCPECGGNLKHEMGCVTCTSCGYSKCD